MAVAEGTEIPACSGYAMLCYARVKDAMLYYATKTIHRLLVDRDAMRWDEMLILHITGAAAHPRVVVVIVSLDTVV